MAAVASGALLVLAVVGIVALLGGGGPGSAGEAPLELESMAKQRHFHRVFQKLEKKPSSGDVARAARERKHAIASMSPQQARNVLVKWGFLPPAQGASTSTRQALKQVAAHHRSGDARAPKDGAPGSRSAEFARLRREASDDDMRPRRPDRTDERDEDADSRAVERDREIANRAKSAREAAREREAAHEGEKRGDGRGEAPHGDARAHGDDRTRRASEHERRLDGQRAEHAARATGFDHLEDVAMGLATAVHDDQEGILHEKKKLTSDRNKLLQTRELIDKALSHLAEKSREPRVDRDSADFTIKVRGDEQQRQLAEQSERAQTRDYWKIPIRPGEERAREAPAQQDSQWAHIRRRRAPDARANAGADAGTLYPVDPLALEEAASADGLQNVPASMASQLIGKQAPSLAATADTYVSNVFGAQGTVAPNAPDTSTRLRSAQPVQVQQYRKVLRMVDAMKGGGSGSMVSTYGANYASGTAGQPYAAENPANTRFGETSAQLRRDGSYLSDVFARK